MNKYYYDLHIHSCLSPCGDEDMTPNNIAGMSALCGLNIVALTDHCSCKNCPAFMAAAKKQGLIAVPGMELTTAEEIHVVCLFERLEDAMSFDAAVHDRLIKIDNRPEIFGEQLILDENDETVGTEQYLLINATDISYEEVPGLVSKHGGVCFPAHIDRPSNGVIAMLGSLPDIPPYGIAELNDITKLDEMKAQYPVLGDMLILTSSDAHYLTNMRDASAYFELDDEPYSGDRVRAALFETLRKHWMRAE